MASPNMGGLSLPCEGKVCMRVKIKRVRGIVFPSYLRAEAFGVTLLEGAMYGKPLISTEVGSGTSHVNVDGETGIVVTPGSSKALRHAMDQLYTRPEMAALMGKRARKRYEQLFTGELMGRRYDGKTMPRLSLNSATFIASDT